MNRPSRRAAAALTTCAVVVLIATSVGAASAAPDDRPVGPATRSVPGSIPSAQEALARAQALFAGPAVTARAARGGAASGVDPHSVTLVLRDLAARRSELTGADRAAAAALLARPSQSPDPDRIVSWNGNPEESTCSGAVPVCVHWTTAGRHQPDLTDDSANGVPDWVDTTLAEMETVWSAEITVGGYKEPVSDLTSPENGVGAELDIYLADIGDLGYYGYCTSDDPDLDAAITPQTSAVSAYCVLDDDYSGTQFPALTPLKNLQVTAAHEFFHAVQFGYDFYEDRWLMESSAAWIEDVVYDSVNDNRQYLPASPLRQPLTSLDKGRSGTQYGSWIFLRYLSDRYDDALVRRIWEWADDSPDQLVANDLKTYSLRAVDSALGERSTSLRAQYGDFAAANVVPSAFYEEGAAYKPVRPPVLKVSKSRPATKRLFVDLDHLSWFPIAIKAGDGVSRKARLRVAVDGPGAAAQPEARVVIRYASGRVQVRRVGLDGGGDGTVTVPFGRTQVASAVVVLVNASSRYTDCFTGNPFGGLSCWGGSPVDNDKRYLFRASLR